MNKTGFRKLFEKLAAEGKPVKALFPYDYVCYLGEIQVVVEALFSEEEGMYYLLESHEHKHGEYTVADELHGFFSAKAANDYYQNLILPGKRQIGKNWVVYPNPNPYSIGVS